jgi:hypothetical protein
VCRRSKVSNQSKGLAGAILLFALLWACAPAPRPAATPILSFSVPAVPKTATAETSKTVTFVSSSPAPSIPTPIAATTRATSNNRLPIFDTHVHYSRNSWSEYSPQDILTKLVNANVARALVSSSPDEGTRRLYALDPVRIVPGLRPYHDNVDQTNWETSDKTLPYLQERIDSPIYVALGEIHVHVQNIESPIFKSAVRRALTRNLVLHIHSDARTIRAVFALEPNAKILWAHAGLTESPQTVSAVLDDFPNLWTDISIRESAIAPAGKLSDEWRALFLKHPDRITIGSDTWIPERWTSYETIIELDRTWLDQLPRDVAEKIAYRNAVELFGRGDEIPVQK